MIRCSYLGERVSEQEKKRGGGAKVSRSETVSVRFDPRLRWLAEIAARVQRRSVSSYIEAAVEQNLQEVLLDKEPRVSVADSAKLLWRLSEASRLARLSRLYPHLLTHEEEKLVRAALQAHQALGITSRDEEDQADDFRPYWEFIKTAVADEMPIKEILAGVVKLQMQIEGTGPVTAERIDKRIEALHSDIKKLEAMKEELKNSEPESQAPPAVKSRKQ
jgi:uncharacterized protein (DUF1778 family)